MLFWHVPWWVRTFFSDVVSLLSVCVCRRVSWPLTQEAVSRGTLVPFPWLGERERERNQKLQAIAKEEWEVERDWMPNIYEEQTEKRQETCNQGTSCSSIQSGVQRDIPCLVSASCSVKSVLSTALCLGSRGSAFYTKVLTNPVDRAFHLAPNGDGWLCFSHQQWWRILWGECLWVCLRVSDLKRV